MSKLPKKMIYCNFKAVNQGLNDVRRLIARLEKKNVKFFVTGCELLEDDGEERNRIVVVETA